MAEDRPVSLKGAPGNLRFVPGEDVENALGAAAHLTIVRGMLRAVVEDPQGLTEEDFEEFEKTLDFLATEDLAKHVESLQATVRRSRLSRFARFVHTSATPSPPVAKKALCALPPIPRKRCRIFEELEEEEEERRIAATSKIILNEQN
ncbi:hypothetical protein TGAM01_v203707 [Trichoderma gamsii]|uniref:Uncharacterized protein n=1 Tax=Trichoderma gamsii TaxID=398673 RepID=A0A2P4ZSP9_9HYPO|nr:hypothetical protein TGAM01_v203707 [Trichoderma gamsii]PON27326.1 hypothetical protein TGAM01_v203707 [Trichoderma gamsii]